MVTPTNPQTKVDIIKPLQWVTEGDRVATPANYGAVINSATFALVGNNIEINPQRDVQHADTIVLGTEGPVGAVKTQSNYVFSFKWQPFDSALFPYIWDDTAANGGTGGAGSPDASLQFTWSERINGTEYFTHVRGFTPTSLTLSMERGLWQAEMSGVAQDITARSSTDGNTGTPVYDSSEGDTAVPLGNSDVGATPFTWNSNVFGERRFSLTVTRDLAIHDVNGKLDILYSKPSTRNISYSVDVFSGSNAGEETSFEDEYEAKSTITTAQYIFTVSPDKKFVFTNNVITSYSKVIAAGTTDAMIESITVRAESGTDL